MAGEDEVLLVLEVVRLIGGDTQVLLVRLTLDVADEAIVIAVNLMLLGSPALPHFRNRDLAACRTGKQCARRGTETQSPSHHGGPASSIDAGGGQYQRPAGKTPALRRRPACMRLTSLS